MTVTIFTVVLGSVVVCVTVVLAVIVENFEPKNMAQSPEAVEYCVSDNLLRISCTAFLILVLQS